MVDMTRIASAFAAALVMAPLAGAAQETDEAGKYAKHVRFGLDAYYGVTNIGGYAKRQTDGQWAGLGFTFPSVVQAEWSPEANRSLHLSLGIGDLYTGSGRTVVQPVQCYWKIPDAAGGALTLGKYYTPVGVQEWEYETRWGAMYERERGSMSYTVAANYNRDSKRLNASARIGRKVCERSTVGLSACIGRGHTYATSHTWGAALDATHEASFGTLTAEHFVAYAGSRANTLQVTCLRAASRPLGSCTPYVGAYFGRDRSDEIGNFSSGVAGVQVRATPFLEIEPGYARTGGRHVWWLQSHITF